jgi:hypothetical protein
VGLNLFPEDSAVGVEGGYRGLLVILHQARVASNISDQDRRELATRLQDASS